MIVDPYKEIQELKIDNNNVFIGERRKGINRNKANFRPVKIRLF